MKIGLLTTLWKRPELSRVMMEYYADMDLVRVAVRSDPQFEVDGWEYVNYPNDPLGAKWQAGLRRLRELDVDVVITVGSDDFLCERYFDHVREGGFDYLQLESFYFLCAKTSRAIYGKRLRVGAARAFSKHLLDATDWKLWPDVHRTLDAAQDKLLVKYDPVLIPDIREVGIMAVDVKTDVNRWSFDHLAEKTINEAVDSAPLLHALPCLSEIVA